MNNEEDIDNHMTLKFYINYQMALENYSNAIKFYVKYTKIIEEVDKIVNEYKIIIKDFQKKLKNLNRNLLSIFNTNEQFSFKEDKLIFPDLYETIKYLNSIIANQINSLTNQINGFDSKFYFNKIKKNVVDNLQNNKNLLQNEEKKLEKIVNEYDSEHEKLMGVYKKSEELITKFFIQKRKDKLNNMNNINSDEPLTNAIADTLKYEEQFNQIYFNFENNNTNYFQIYNTYLKELENEIDTKYNYFNNNINLLISIILDLYKDISQKLNKLNKKENISKSSKEIQTFKKEENIEIENNDNILNKINDNKYKDFNHFMNKHFNKFESQYIKQNYKVKALNETFSDIIISNDSQNPDNILDNNNPILISQEEIYEIAKIFFGAFKYVDRSEYNLVLEKYKLNVKNLTNNLLYYGFLQKQQKIYPEPKPITDEEISMLSDFLKKKKEYRITFLQILNNFRSLGIFEIPQKEYKITCDYFKLILDVISDKKEIEFESTMYIVILAHTFFVNKNKEKHYLFDDLRDHKIFNIKEYWEKYLNFSINKEILKSKETNRIGKMSPCESLVRDIGFSNALSFCKNMKDFGMDKNLILEIIEPLIEKYKINEENKEILLGFI